MRCLLFDHLKPFPQLNKEIGELENLIETKVRVRGNFHHELTLIFYSTKQIYREVCALILGDICQPNKSIGRA